LPFFLLAFPKGAGQSRSALKVLIIPDKFKGTLTARQAGEAIAEGWRAIREDDQLEILPMSDGGDGFGEIIGGMMGAEPIDVNTADAAHRPHKAKFWFDAKSKTAVIEAAQVNGLALLPQGRFHPFELDTYGLGKLYLTAIKKGAQIVYFGIGGSSTNDGGFGFARAIGWRFLDERGGEIKSWTQLEALTRIVAPALNLVPTTVGVDVQNPLLGSTGAGAIYGPQKGLRLEDMPKAEACLRRLTEAPVEGRSRPLDEFAKIPGSGAAGGLGFGLSAFADATFQPGFDIFAKSAELETRLETAEIVISGEGSMDAQTLMGKGVGALYQLCQKNNVKFMGLAGSLSLDLTGTLQAGASLWGIVPTFATLDQAKAEPAKYLRLLASEAAKNVGSV
jgi:glycerate kinase